MFVTQTYKSLEVPPVFLQRLKPGSAGAEERENPTVSSLVCRLLLLPLSRFSCVRLCATLWTAAQPYGQQLTRLLHPQDSLGKNRSGLPFLSPVCSLN